MDDPQLRLPREPEEESFSGKIFLRSIVVCISLLFGFVIVLFGYFIAIFLEIEVTEFNESPAVFFLISLLVWMILGLVVSRDALSRFLGGLKGTSGARILLYVIAIVVCTVLYWFALTMIISIFTGSTGTG